MPARNRDHYRGSYARMAKSVRAAAYANPDTRCWQCGRTLAEHGRKWQAGHMVDGQARGALIAECEGCNTSRGAAMGNAKREPVSKRWW